MAVCNVDFISLCNNVATKSDLPSLSFTPRYGPICRRHDVCASRCVAYVLVDALCSLTSFTAVRIRPTTSQDTVSIPARFQRTVIQAASTTSVQVDSTQSTPTAPTANGAQVPPSAGPTKKQFYTFDQVHHPATSQHALYQATAEPLISRFLQGFNCTILAYGQTSSGKTYSMAGIDLDADPSDPHNGMGIIPRSVSSIFQRAKQMKEEHAGGWSYSVKSSFIEIYNEDLIDLLGEESVKREVQIREDKDGHIIWGGLREVSVRNAGEVMK